MNKFLAMVVWVTGYLGASRILWMIVPKDMPLDNWGDVWFFVLMGALVFMPIWMCVAFAGKMLWKLEEVK